MLPALDGQLLLYCLQVAAKVESAGWFRLFTAADWDAVVCQADHHELGPLLFWLFGRPGVVRPPDDVMTRLEDRYRRAARDSDRAFAQLAALLVALRDDGIPVILLKGAALAETVYDERALRPMSDFDLLVQRSDLARAEAALRRLGFLALENYFGDKAVFVEHCHHLVPYEHPGSGVAVDLHWNLAMPADGVVIDPDGLWRRARPARVPGAEALVLADEDLLLHLCLHATALHHLEIKLRDAYDVALLVRRRRDELDFAEVRRRATDLGLRRCTYVVLELARQLLDAPLDRAFLGQLRDDPLDDCLVPLFRDRVLHGTGTNLFQMLWRRREAGPGRYWKDYCDIPFGGEPLWGVEESGFHEQEVDQGRPVRWTDGAARLVVPVDAAHPPRALAVRLWVGPGGTMLRLRANGVDLVAEYAPPGAWSATLALPEAAAPRLTLELLSDTFVPRACDGTDDDRQLGVLVLEMRLLGTLPDASAKRR